MAPLGLELSVQELQQQYQASLNSEIALMRSGVQFGRREPTELVTSDDRLQARMEQTAALGRKLGNLLGPEALLVQYVY